MGKKPQSLEDIYEMEIPPLVVVDYLKHKKNLFLRKVEQSGNSFTSEIMVLLKSVNIIIKITVILCGEV